MPHQKNSLRNSKPAKTRKTSESSEGSSNSSDGTPEVEIVSNLPLASSPEDQSKKTEIYPWMKESRAKGRNNGIFDLIF